ncbi:molecular chaperone TorD family protein [Labrenzia sp. R4_1]|jgi:TorA maturation chaperone TorD|uniref:TorD/DmsD family molecular chaperone n=1 Tax=Stappiaceae TaxID=2821832 RepID=UPI000929589C|nr:MULTISPECIES: molecular chaperone TorD family protein [unclassified Labrenzia]MBO9421092.1 molecular chaperone TorD family protein [Labrenzia sp. R4_2]MBO9425957.1 molecular chaperone TorD family protein [Labrenzia sp. R4_1]OJJ10290.1 molecular chaperone TorD [Alphaproteobacteria bacterium AO1-B]
MAAVVTEYVIDPEDQARADLYNFLGVLLAKPADNDLLRQIAALSGDDTPLGTTLKTLAKLASVTSEQDAEREFNALFIGLGRGELLPYASHYLTGFLNEKPLANLRQEMAERGIQRAEGKKEPEDNIASLMEIMGGLIVGRFGKVTSVADQKSFFNAHVGPWAVHFFSDLEASRTSVLYSAVGSLGRQFMEIEAEAFEMLPN